MDFPTDLPCRKSILLLFQSILPPDKLLPEFLIPGTLLWQIDFKNPTDYNKVMDYLDNEKEEDILKYARDKEFWEKLIWG